MEKSSGIPSLSSSSAGFCSLPSLGSSAGFLPSSGLAGTVGALPSGAFFSPSADLSGVTGALPSVAFFSPSTGLAGGVGPLTSLGSSVGFLASPGLSTGGSPGTGVRNDPISGFFLGSGIYFPPSKIFVETCLNLRYIINRKSKAEVMLDFGLVVVAYSGRGIV